MRDTALFAMAVVLSSLVNASTAATVFEPVEFSAYHNFRIQDLPDNGGERQEDGDWQEDGEAMFGAKCQKGTKVAGTHY